MRRIAASAVVKWYVLAPVYILIMLAIYRFLSWGIPRYGLWLFIPWMAGLVIAAWLLDQRTDAGSAN